jgi:hypothetical protein
MQRNEVFIKLKHATKLGSKGEGDNVSFFMVCGLLKRQPPYSIWKNIFDNKWFLYLARNPNFSKLLSWQFGINYFTRIPYFIVSQSRQYYLFFSKDIRVNN